MTFQALTVAGLVAHLELLMGENPAVASWPVVLATDVEGVLARPVGTDTPVCVAGWQPIEKGHGDLRGEVENCVVIWPAV